MPLLSGMFRSAAIYGSTDTLSGRLAGRQGGRWAQQTVQTAMPGARPDPALRELEDLNRRGVISHAELQALRARLRV